MNRKNKHINKYLHDNLPEPEIPADDAWAQMNGMLETVPADNTQSIAGKVTGLISKFKLPLMIISGVSALLVMTFLFLKSEPKSILQKTENIEQIELSENLPLNEKNKNTDSKTNKITGPETDNIATSKIDSESKDKLSVSKDSAIHSKTEVYSSKTDDRKAHGFASSSHEKEHLTHSKKRNSTRQRYQNQAAENLNVTRNSGSNILSGKASQKSSVYNPVYKGLSKNESSITNEFLGKKVDTASNIAAQKPILSIQPILFHIKTFNPELGKSIKNHQTPKPKPPVAETKEPMLNTLHFGLEWSLNTSLQRTDYLFTGADSISRPARLLIPGIFVSKNWRKHGLIASFAPYQSYFGNNKLIQHQTDSTYAGDSVQFFRNTSFLKAVVINFTLQYQYKVAGFLSLSAGASYSPFSKALFRKATENREGTIVQGPLETVKKSGNLGSYLNPQLFAFKAGLLFHPGRFQAGFNVIVPLSNVSGSSEYPVKALNGQVFLRFLVK